MNCRRLLLSSGVMAARHMTRAATRAPRRALPRRRALCTNSKKPRYSGNFSCEMPRCGVSGAFAPSRSALKGSGCFGGPGPGQQLGEAAVGPVVDELGQHVGEVGLRVDGIQLAGLDQRGEHGPVFRAFVAASE